MKAEQKLALKILRHETCRTENINWSEFIKFTKKNGLLGVIYKNMNSLNIKIPKNIKKDLRNFYLYNTKRNLIFINEWKKILKNSKAYKKNMILLKGFSTINLTKQELGERHLSDIDILCLKNEKKVTEIIKSLGYIGRKNYSDYFYKKYFHHSRPLIKNILNTNVIIEIHQQLEQKNSPFQIPISNSSFEYNKFSNFRYKSIKPEDALVYLCTQTSYNDFFFFGLRNLLDIKQLIKRQKINWDKIITKSEDWKCSSFVYKTLNLSKELLNAEVPDKTLEKIKENANRYQLFILKFTEKNLFSKKNMFFSNLQKWILRILLGKNIRQKITLIIEALMFLILRFKKNYKIYQ